MNQPARNVSVGWARNSSDNGYLTWDGDKRQDGVESVLIDISKLSNDYSQQKSFEVLCRAFWFNAKGTGNLEIEFETYKGCSMNQQSYNFVNSNGMLVQSLKIAVNTTIQ